VQGHHASIFGDKIAKFFPSVLHAADKLSRGYLPRVIAEGTMPSSTSAMSIAPVGIVNAGHPRAAAAQAMEIASLIHVTEVGFCQDAAAAVAAAVATALSPGSSVESVLASALNNVRPWSGREMRTLMTDALALARGSQDFKEFRTAYLHGFRRAIACDSRETVPAVLAIVWLAGGDPWQAAMFGANFGRDTDTIACMAAGICGALTGLDGETKSRLNLLPPQSIALQQDLARQLVEVHHARAASERKALSNAL
jgi:ADP-ribosylglycohydrolase